MRVTRSSPWRTRLRTLLGLILDSYANSSYVKNAVGPVSAALMPALGLLYRFGSLILPMCRRCALSSNG
jgi:hypothetical protein